MLIFVLVKHKKLFMGVVKYRIECIVVDSELTKCTIERVFGTSLSVGDCFYQVFVPDTNDCYSFCDFDDVLKFVKTLFTD